jgi:hypothetical protein
MRRLFSAILLLAACSRGPVVPVNTLLWRLDRWTAVEPNVRRAAAKFISFRANGQYIEHFCYVIEQPDSSVYISHSDPHVVTVGNWTFARPEIVTTRRLVSRPKPYSGGTDPLCSESKFTISGNSVLGADGQYSPVTRLVAPDFDEYVKDAERTGAPCPASSPSR